MSSNEPLLFLTEDLRVIAASASYAAPSRLILQQFWTGTWASSGPANGPCQSWFPC
jgi:hypothetical protein